MFLHEDDLSEGTSLSFLEQLNWIFRLTGSNDAGYWACRPPHGEFSCRHSAEHARVRSVATARVVTAVDGPLRSDRRAGAILGVIAGLILACGNGKQTGDIESFTSGGIPFHIDVCHCHPDFNSNLDGEKILIIIHKIRQTKSIYEFESKINNGVVNVVLGKGPPSAGGHYLVQGKHDEYGYTTSDEVLVTGTREERRVEICFNRVESLDSKDYSFWKWSTLMDPNSVEFTELKSVISGRFKNLRLRSKGWNRSNPRKVFELGLLPSAEESGITNVYDYDYHTCEKENGQKKEACHTLVNAKAGLLNIYAALRRSGPDGGPSKKDGKSWWGYIEEIKMIQPDRIVATVKEEMYKKITDIGNGKSVGLQNNSIWESDTWVNRGFNEILKDNELFSPTGVDDVCRCKESENEQEENEKFKRAVAKYHRHNFIAAIDNNANTGEIDAIFSLKSIKSTKKIASIQLTIARIEKKKAKPYYLLDADIDEHTGFPHVADWLRHRIRGVSTNPFQIGEMLRADNDDIKLGYDRK